MKPQALQDAIKAAAARKRDKVDLGGWKEPVVKAHKVTSEEFQASRSRRPQSPSVVPNSSYSSSTPAHGSSNNLDGSVELLRKIQKEREELQREKQALLSEMKDFRREMASNSASIVATQEDIERLRTNVEKVAAESKSLRDQARKGTGNGSTSSFNYNHEDRDQKTLERRVEALEHENVRLKEMLQSEESCGFGKLKDKVARLEDEVEHLREKLKSASTGAPTPTSGGRVTVPAPRSPATAKAVCVSPRSPVVKTKAPTPPLSDSGTYNMSDSGLSRTGWPYLIPHTAEKISKYQARDEALKAYLANPNAPIGMYPRKTMSVESIEGKSLVFFRNKLYIPQKLREKHMQWYLDQYKSDAKEKIVDHCTWPHQEKEMFDFIRSKS